MLLAIGCQALWREKLSCFVHHRLSDEQAFLSTKEDFSAFRILVNMYPVKRTHKVRFCHANPKLAPLYFVLRFPARSLD